MNKALAWGKLIVALDLENKIEINKVITVLSPKGVKFKIGSIAFTKFGPEFVRTLIERKVDIFLDLKLHDIPNTMKQTAAVITELGCWAFSIHLEAGKEALEAVKQGVATRAKISDLRPPLILGITILTSTLLPKEGQILRVARLTKLAEITGMSGVVASPLEVKSIKHNCPALIVVTPGIRNPEDSPGDQKRIATAGEAFSAGADYIVVGRPIITKDDYLKAAEDILQR